MNLERFERRLSNLEEWIYKVDSARAGPEPWLSPYVDEALQPLNRYDVAVLVSGLLRELLNNLKKGQ